jgi:hypothetical protein
MRSLGVAALLLLVGLHVGRAEVLGGGLANTDCRLVFSGVTATNGRSGVVCTDSDPTCDDDGAADGTCHFSVAVCTGTPTGACTTTPFSAITVAGLGLVPPRVPAPDGTCGAPLAVAVPVGTSAGATGLARDAASLRDVDYLDLCCVSSAATPLDAARCAVAIRLPVSGCSASRIPRRARTAFARARALVAAFVDEPTHRRPLDRALGRLAVVRRAAQGLAKHDACGDALGLVASYAEDAVGAARPVTPGH